MWRVGILLKGGKNIATNLKTKEECEEWLLNQAEKQDIKKSIIVNKDNIKERFIETWT